MKAIGILSDWKLYVGLFCIIIALVVMALLSTPKRPRSHLTGARGRPHPEGRGHGVDMNGGVGAEPGGHDVVAVGPAQQPVDGVPADSTNTEQSDCLESVAPAANSAGSLEEQPATTLVRVQIPRGDAAAGGSDASADHAETGVDDATEYLQAHRHSVSSVMGSLFAGWGGRKGGVSPDVAGSPRADEPLLSPPVESHVVTSFQLSDGSSVSTEFR